MNSKTFLGYPLNGLIHITIVYIVWSSTYLAIRVAVAPGGWEPFFMGFLRMVAATIILFIIAIIQSKRLRPTTRELIKLAMTGVLMWALSHGCVLWAEQKLPSSYASLLIGSTPILVTIMDYIYNRRPPTPKLVVALLIGFVGLFVLLSPTLFASTSRFDVYSTIAVLLASAFWGAGTLLQNQRPFQLSTVVISGYQHLFGGIAYIIMSVASGEQFILPTTLNPWLAWLYLLIFGSIIAFSSYTIAVKLLPVNIAISYAYINPVIAMFLGWLILKEIIYPEMFIGATLIIIGVFVIYKVRFEPPPAIRKKQSKES